MKKLNVGENVYILREGQDIVGDVLKGTVTECLIDDDTVDNIPYRITDENDRDHILYYPCSLDIEYIATREDYIEELKDLKRRNKETIERIEIENKKADKKINKLSRR